MTREILNKVAKDLGINPKDYDFVNGEYTNSRESFIEVSFWKDSGTDSNRGRYDVRTKRYSVTAIAKKHNLAGGAYWGDYLTGGAKRIFNIK